MLLTKSYLKQLIRECLNEEPTKWNVGDATVDRRLYNQNLKQGHTLYYPNAKDEEHERMRMKTLLFYRPNPQQYYLRLTKITNPQKMYSAYLILSDEYKYQTNNNKKQLIWKALQITVKYLMQNGYGAYVTSDDRRIFG